MNQKPGSGLRSYLTVFLLAALMDASRAELERDYGESYVNYYHLTTGEKRYAHYVGAGVRYFCRCLGAREDEEHLQPYAEKYVLGLGLSEDEVAKLKERLGTTWNAEKP